MIIALIVGYIAVYALLNPITGGALGMLVALPTAVIAWRFGLRSGLVAWGIAVIFNTLLMPLPGDKLGISLQIDRVLDYVVLFFFTVSLGSIHELSRRLRTELLMRQEAEQVEQRRSGELEAVYRASLQLTSSLELKPLLSTILDQTVALLNSQEVHIFLYDGGKLSFGAAFWEGKQRETAFRVPRPDGFTTMVARTRQRTVVPDISQYEMFLSRNWTGAVVGVPLAVGEHVYGVMNVGFTEPHNFSDNELRIIQILADQASIALRNAHEYEDTRHYAEALERSVTLRTTELLRAKESAEALLNNSFDVILLLNADGIIQQINPAFARVFGIEQGVGRVFATLFQEESTIEEALRSTITSRTTQRFETNARRENGEFTADLALVPLDSAGAGVEIICNLRDVTERKQAEIRQRALMTGLRKVLTLAYELISSPDIDGLWKRAVERAREELGLERCGIFIDADGRMNGTYGTDIHGQTTDEHDLHFLKSERSWLSRENMLSVDAPPWQLVYEELRNWQGQESVKISQGWMAITPIYSAYRFIGIFSNDSAITSAPVDEIKQEVVAVFCSLLGNLYEHKRVEDEVHRALSREKELSELKSRFTSMISHELRTPLSSIQLSSDLLKLYSDRLGPEGIKEHLDRIQAQVRHLTNLLEDVLTFTKAEQIGLQPQLKKLDLKAFCADLSAEVRATNATHQVAFTDVEGSWISSFDAKLFRQALMNLLLNAVKYSPPDSTVTLSLAREGQDAIIRVADQGIGIPESDLPRIFEVFYRAKNVGTVSGTGLGLALVRQIAEAHHGFVFCESQLGTGTTFTLRFPAFA